MMLANH